MNIQPTLLNAYLPTCFLVGTAINGFFLTIFLFLLCFLLVHILILLKLGWKAQQQASQPEKKDIDEEKKLSEPKKTDKEPIYYIVERKRTRPKQHYGEPKEFRFK